MYYKLLMNKKKHDEELVEEHGQGNEQMQMLMKLVEKTSLEGHIGKSSQTYSKIAKLTDKNNIEVYLMTCEYLMEVYKLYKSHWFFHPATQLTE